MAEDRRAAGHPPHCLTCSRCSLRMERPGSGGRGSTACGEWLCGPLAPGLAWLSANVVCGLCMLTVSHAQFLGPLTLGSYLLSLKTELGGNEGWRGSIAVPETGADDWMLLILRPQLHGDRREAGIFG